MNGYKKGLVDAKKAGLVRSIKHPTLPLTLWHYTHNCMFKSRNWNHFTRMARGIVTKPNGQIVAKPFEKFFNVGEMHETMPDQLPIHIPYECTKKLDGSLIELYFYEDEMMVHTKGAFDNEQGRLAKLFIKRNMRKEQVEYFCKAQNYTLLFEIMYPGNGAIHYDFFENDKDVHMQLIGCIHNRTFEDKFHDQLLEIGDAIHCKVVKRYDDMELKEAYEYNEPGTEGFVIRFTNGLRVKVKTPWYHSVFRAKYFWTPLKIVDLIINTPEQELSKTMLGFTEEERHAVLDQMEYIKGHYNAIENWALQVYEKVRHEKERKRVAKTVTKEAKDIADICFLMYDHKDPAPAIWKKVRRIVKEEKGKDDI